MDPVSHFHSIHTYEDWTQDNSKEFEQNEAEQSISTESLDSVSHFHANPIAKQGYRNKNSMDTIMQDNSKEQNALVPTITVSLDSMNHFVQSHSLRQGLKHMQDNRKERKAKVPTITVSLDSVSHFCANQDCNY